MTEHKTDFLADYAMELPLIVVMHVFSQESAFSELDLTAFTGTGGASPKVSVLLFVEALLPTSRVLSLTSNTLHSLSRSLPSN